MVFFPLSAVLILFSTMADSCVKHILGSWLKTVEFYLTSVNVDVAVCGACEDFFFCFYIFKFAVLRRRYQWSYSYSINRSIPNLLQTMKRK